MKHKSLVFVVLATVLLIFGCGQQNPTALQSADGTSLAKRTITPVQGEVDLGPAEDPGRVFVDEDGVTHFVGATNLGTFTGDLGEGSVTFVFNATLDATGSGPFNGQVTLATDQGTWEGHVRGQTVFGQSSGEFKLQGTGEFAGMKVLGTFEEIDDTGVIAFEATLVQTN
ncbi:MAG: hypothetical protein ACE5HO_08585 [bacterium]